MIFIRVINFIIKISKGITFIFFLFLTSIIIASISLANKKSDNQYCINVNIEEVTLNYESIQEYEYKINCSTIYLYIILKDDVNTNDSKTISYDIIEKLKVYKCFVHLQLNGKSLNKTMYSTYDYKYDKVSFLGG